MQKNRKTASELLFENFCSQNNLDCKSIPTGNGKTADFQLRIGISDIQIEIKQIESIRGYNDNGVSSRTVGWHVRNKISEARAQIQKASSFNYPSILLIHNLVDPLQMFGTEPHDFIAAMYGEMTVRLVNGAISDLFHGRNANLRDNSNTSFSAVGHLKRTKSGAEAILYENIYAKNPLPFADIPSCISVFRFELERILD